MTHPAAPWQARRDDNGRRPRPEGIPVGDAAG